MNWYPSRYGAGDEAGALNEITADAVVRAARLVRTGRIFDLAHVLDAGAVITPGDAEKALAGTGLAVGPGDAVLFHTGWGAQWGADNDAYSAGEPGPGMALGAWLADHRVALTGCDTWSFGPVPPEDPDEPFVVPQILNAHHGVVVLENLGLAELAAAGVAEFLLVVSHAKLRGATGAWVAPLAIV